MMGRKMKRYIEDENGFQILEKFGTYYLAKTPEGTIVRVNVKKNASKTTGTVSNLKPAEKPPENNFTKGDNAKKAAEITARNKMARRQAKEAKEITGSDMANWRNSQRDCLRVMLRMESKVLYAYAVKWGQITPEACAIQYGFAPSQSELDNLIQAEPTMLQIVCLSMVIRAKDDGKFGLQILEMIEGRAVNQVVLEETIAKKEEKKEDAKPKEGVDRTLEQLKDIIFKKEETPVEPVTDLPEEETDSAPDSTPVEHDPVEAPEKPTERFELNPDQLEGEELIAFLANGGEL